MSGTTSLSNHLLIAMPQLADPNFSQTVSLICEHGEKGALGIVLNRPLSMTLSEVFEQMKIEPTDRRAADLPVLRGGPVHQDRRQLRFGRHQRPNMHFVLAGKAR